MKRFLNVTAALLTICLASTAFVSCSSDSGSDDDDTSSASSSVDVDVAAIWSDGESSIIFYRNGMASFGNTTIDYVGNPALTSGTVTLKLADGSRIEFAINGNSATATIDGTTETWTRVK